MHVRAGFLVATLVVALCPPVHAEPGPRDVARARQAVRDRAKELGTASAELAEAQGRLDRLAVEAERLVEAYNGEVVRLRQAEQAHLEAAERQSAATTEVERARQAVAMLAAQSYGGLPLPAEYLGMLNDRGDHDGYLHRAGLLRQLGGERGLLLTRLRDAEEVAEILTTHAASVHAAQQYAAEAAERAKIAAREAVARQRRETKELRARRDELQRLVDAARTRAELLARRRQTRIGHVPLSSGSSMGDVAANWALTQLGKPYLWAADGPASYDCSGLTMRAWERAGVRLDHWTGTQWTSGPHVPLDQLRRGDLLFFGYDKNDPSTIHHVGMYVAPGLMVHAPQTGDVVRIASMWRGDLVGATRPR
ncbi:C40 family peptidase [Nonomuraea ceibae]|uniref:C40 family peptidase n=1 Tax=Nonomuraea ceibae TaxID=1935170 RepID=UPI001C5D0A08|nr:C40 family peptidase [Nonomuraea ceibae]